MQKVMFDTLSNIISSLQKRDRTRLCPVCGEMRTHVPRHLQRAHLWNRRDAEEMGLARCNADLKKRKEGGGKGRRHDRCPIMNCRSITQRIDIHFVGHHQVPRNTEVCEDVKVVFFPILFSSFLFYYSFSFS